ncbi:MAG: hypothetical protein II304_05935 [Bacteroidales bacterium]|nr:hypothetical protein [Bacteroidales bacterium]
MRLFKIIKDIASPVPSFGNTGPIKFRSMSFGTADSLKAYLDATLNLTPEGKIAITCEDAERVIDYLPTYFEDKEVEYVDSYDVYFKSTGVNVNLRNVPDAGTFGAMIPLMTTGLPKRLTGHLSSSSQSLE